MNLGTTGISTLYVGSTEASKAYIGSTLAWSAFSVVGLSPYLWFDASDSTTLYDATSGGSAVAADGSVARWEDKSGNARHITQSTSGNRPLRKTSIQNSLDAIRFDGSNDYLATASFVVPAAVELYVVMISRASQYKVIAAHASGFQNPFPGATYLFTNNQKIETSQNANPVEGDFSKLSQRLTSSNVATTDTCLLVGRITGTTHAEHKIRINGSDASVTSPFSNDPGSYTKASAAFSVGAYSAGGSPGQVDICELVYVPALSTDDRTSLESYLMTKWGL